MIIATVLMDLLNITSQDLEAGFASLLMLGLVINFIKDIKNLKK